MINFFNSSKLYSYFLVISQFSLIFILGKNASINNINLVNFTLCVFGLIIGFWAIWVTRKAKITVLPDVRKGSVLITKGPYKFIRHPMYSAVILFSLGLLFMNYKFSGSLIFLFLNVILIFKIKYEEELLTKKFSEYKDYKLKTKKLIPFVY